MFEIFLLEDLQENKGDDAQESQLEAQNPDAQESQLEAQNPSDDEPSQSSQLDEYSSEDDSAGEVTNPEGEVASPEDDEKSEEEQRAQEEEQRAQEKAIKINNIRKYLESSNVVVYTSSRLGSNLVAFEVNALESATDFDDETKEYIVELLNIGLGKDLSDNPYTSMEEILKDGWLILTPQEIASKLQGKFCVLKNIPSLNESRKVPYYLLALKHDKDNELLQMVISQERR